MISFEMIVDFQLKVNKIVSVFRCTVGPLGAVESYSENAR